MGEPFRTREVNEGEEEELDDEYKDMAKELFGETDEKRLELVEEMKRQVEMKGYQVPTRKAFLLKFIRAGNFTVDGALKVLTNYVKLLQEFPNYFAYTSLGELRLVASQQTHTVLRTRDKHRRRVYVVRPGKWDPSKITYAQCYKFGFMLNEMVAQEPRTQVAGLTTIVDGAGFGLGHFRHLTFSDIRSGTRFLQESFPLWFRSFHVVNASYYIYLSYYVVRPMLSRTLRESIHFHGSTADLQSHVDGAILPEELGGEGGGFSNGECLGALEAMLEHFEELKTLRIN